jgi:hypothetical protein
MKKRALILAGIAMLVSFTASAHHATAEFDYKTAYRVVGVVKEFQWTNPHSWVQVLVPNDKGGRDQWGFELGAPLFNARMGWRKNSLTAGEPITVLFCPSRTRARGTLMSITLADGSILYGVAHNFYKGPPITDTNQVSAPPPLEAE